MYCAISSSEGRCSYGPGQETLQRAIDQPRVQRVHRIPAEPEPVHRAGAEILDQRIGVAHQVLRHRQPLGRLHVDADAALVAVEIGEEPGGEAVQPAGAIAVRRGLDADHVGAKIGQHDAAGRSHHSVAELEHGQIGERQDCHGSGVLDQIEQRLAGGPYGQTRGRRGQFAHRIAGAE